jgi:peptidyl-prolyl cis-trans isomerase C
MRFRLLSATILATVLFAVAPVAQAADAPKSADDPVIATVNGKDIHLNAVKELYLRNPKARQVPFQQAYAPLVDEAIVRQLVLDMAKKDKLENDPKVKAAFADAQNNILQQAWIMKRVDADVTESQIKARFDEESKKMQPEEQVKVRHILVDSEEAAKAVLADLKSGVSFEEEARNKSKDPSAQKNGGELDFISRKEVVPEFSDAAFKLKPGEWTQTPVKTQFGWHIIKVEDRRMAPPPTFEQAHDEIKNILAQEDLSKVLENVRAGAQIKRFNPDGSPLVAPAPVPAPASGAIPALKP